jgi:hypothetical protein
MADDAEIEAMLRSEGFGGGVSSSGEHSVDSKFEAYLNKSSPSGSHRSQYSSSSARSAAGRSVASSTKQSQVRDAPRAHHHRAHAETVHMQCTQHHKLVTFAFLKCFFFLIYFEFHVHGCRGPYRTPGHSTRPRLSNGRVHTRCLFAPHPVLYIQLLVAHTQGLRHKHV